MNFFAYREPEENETHIFQADKAMSLPSGTPTIDGFILSPFDSKASHIHFYPYIKKLDKIPQQLSYGDEADAPHHGSGDYEDYVSRAIEEIKKGGCKKIVTADSKVVSCVKPPARLFKVLCGLYPRAFVFLFSTEEFGVWIGATPELLLQRRGNRLSTMALAGTRPASEENRPWDEKNVEEQRWVSQHILEVLERNGCAPVAEEPRTQRAGNIEHIMTPITAQCSDGMDIIRVLRKLSPTPALCGTPPDQAMAFIKKNEGDRALYGGFAGPHLRNGDFQLYVLIRCARLQKDKAQLFAGGGVTSLSIPLEEKIEIERKYDTLQSIFFDE